VDSVNGLDTSLALSWRVMAEKVQDDMSPFAVCKAVVFNFFLYIVPLQEFCLRIPLTVSLALFQNTVFVCLENNSVLMKCKRALQLAQNETNPMHL